MGEKILTHLTKCGVHMVEVGTKPVMKRSAVAKGKINLQENTTRLIKSENIKKGNVLTTAQIAAINAVKSTSQIIPLCHPLAITGIEVDFEVSENSIMVQVEVRTEGKTGVEMEAITGVSVALLTIWDMVKSVEKNADGQYPHTRITDIQVIKKEKLPE
ncbi:MAG TPA: cyclic pyranopterin monophosphate synthase MoaC [Methanobacteriaceae archaeon]|nr:cyclic pyranopterin monophosphate synthase MoaC [Methanobacteriaceae archaeon]